jgi:hypothetical protein
MTIGQDSDLRKMPDPTATNFPDLDRNDGRTPGIGGP